LEEGRL